VSGYVGNVDWPQMLNGAVWAPLVLLFLFRVGREERVISSAALAGCSLGLAWLSGHHQVPVFILVAGAILLLYFRRWRAFPVFGVVMVLTSALQTLPAYEYGRLAKRWVGVEEPVGWDTPVPYSVHAGFALTPQSLLGMVLPTDANPSLDPFIGLTALLLAFLGVIATWPAKGTRALLAVMAISILLAIGSYTLVHGLFYSVIPLVEKARVPAAAIVLFHLCVAVLAAFAIDAAAWERRASRVLIWLGSGLLAFFAVQALLGKVVTEQRPLLSGIIALLLAAILAAYARRYLTRAAALGWIFGLLVIEISMVTTHGYAHRLDTNRNKFIGALSRHSDIVRFLRTQPRPIRVEVDDKEIPYNFGDWHGIDTTGGYLAGVTANVLNSPYHERHGKAMFAVTHSIHRAPHRPGEALLFQGEGGINVYSVTPSLPRVRTVHKVIAAMPDEMRGMLSDANTDLAATAISQDNIGGIESCAAKDDLEIEVFRPGALAVTATMACTGLMVVGDSYFPGWTATIDGRPARVHEIYGVVKGVVVPTGTHRVKLEYRPWTVLAGGLMTALGLLTACIVAIKK
jgi:hypothetical protein